MHKDIFGNLMFAAVRQTDGGELLEEFVWARRNFEEHETRHRISDPKALAEIEATICDPDVITEGPQRGKRGLYRVISYQDSRQGRVVMLWRVYCFRRPRSKRHFVIATAFGSWTSAGKEIHYLEKIVWKKPGSKI